MRVLLAALLASAVALPAAAQSFKPLKSQPPNGAGIGFLLTDGTVMFQGGALSDWWKLTPDQFGQYSTGTWSKLASLPSGYQPDAFASAVLADGRVIIEGGEYNGGNFAFTDLGAIYDPKANTWTAVKPPANWKWIGDSPSTVLADGRFLLGRKFDKRVAVLDPKTLTWTELNSTGKKDFDAEEGWTLLPDGSVLTYDVKASPNSERYNVTAQAWTTQGSTVQNLMAPPSVGIIRCCNGVVYRPPGEVGPAILRPDGTVFATGGTHAGAREGHTAIYTPGAKGAKGTWAAGPDFPPGQDSADSFAALLPDGNVLVEAESGQLYEFDGKNLIDTKLNAGGGGSLLVLPTGEVIVGGGELYEWKGKVQAGWAPVIDNVPAVLTRGTTYAISGKQFNGLSQAASFGDEYQTATNYPIVRIQNNASGHVIYARTHDHSSMGVATGSAEVSTNFDLPASAETGASTVEVVANGIASAPVAVTIQ